MTHGTNLQLYDFKLEYTFQDNALAELDRQLALLLSTQVGTMPLDREFGIQQNYVDKPPEVVKSLYTAEVTKKVPQFIHGCGSMKLHGIMENKGTSSQRW